MQCKCLRLSCTHWMAHIKATRAVPPRYFIHLHQLDEVFWKINNLTWASNMLTKCWNWLFDFWRFCLCGRILDENYGEAVMMNCNNTNNAHYISAFTSGFGVKWDALRISVSISSVSCQQDSRKSNKKSKIQQLPWILTWNWKYFECNRT